jgi:hypothetical protein
VKIAQTNINTALYKVISVMKMAEVMVTVLMTGGSVLLGSVLSLLVKGPGGSQPPSSLYPEVVVDIQKP